MKLDNILCPTDFSPSSLAALEKASELARQHDGQLHILHIYELIFVGGYIDGVAPIPVTPDTVALTKQLESLKPAGLTPVYELVYGIPASSVVDYAKTSGIDLIVMGTHSREGLDRVLLGSVAESVMRAAPCPVLTVHAALEAEKEKVAEVEGEAAPAPAPGTTFVW